QHAWCTESAMFFRIVRRVLAVAIVLAFLYLLIFHQRTPYRPGEERHPAERGRRGLPEETHPQDRNGEKAGAPEVGCASQYFARWSEPGDGGCTVKMRNGYPAPDPRCTPGGVNPGVTEAVLRNPAWRT